MSKNVEVTWSGAKRGDKWSRENDPNFRHSLLTGVVLKLEYFDVEINPPSLLGETKETATVYFKYTYKTENIILSDKQKKEIDTIFAKGNKTKLFEVDQLINKYKGSTYLELVMKTSPVEHISGLDVSAIFQEARENLVTEQGCTKKIKGISTEVYAYCLDIISNNNRDLFISTWAIQKDRKYKSMTGVPFRAAATGEKLMTKVTEAGMTPRKFAEKVKKDYSNFFRELKGQTPLTLKQAIEYSKELDCDPVEILFEDLRTDVWGSVDMYNSNQLGNGEFAVGQIIPQAEKSTIVPRNIYTPNLKAIQIKCEGSYLHNHLAFYKKSDAENTAFNGRLVVAGRDDPEFEEYGYDTESYWFGIYDVQKGGKQLILNVDPFAEKKELCHGPFKFIAPVISTMHPNSLKRDYNYYQMNNKSLEYFKIAERQRNILEDKIKLAEIQVQKMSSDIDKLIQKDLLKKNKSDIKMYMDEIEKLNLDVKKRA